MGRIISYRGLLRNGQQDTIPLHTNDGKTGYKIVKFQVMSETPSLSGTTENIVQVWKVKQSSIPSAGNVRIDFSDITLIAAGYWIGSDNPIYAKSEQVIFDNEIFNQDIYVTNRDTDGDDNVNYYIELEQVPLTEDQALVAIVKNLRNEQ